MAEITEKTFRQRSAGQAARRQKNFTIGIIFIMVVIMLGVTAWLIHMSNQTQAELFNDRPAQLNIPITTSASKAVTRKKETKQDTAIPTHRRRPAGVKPRTQLPPAGSEEAEQKDPPTLPEGTQIF